MIKVLTILTILMLMSFPIAVACNEDSVCAYSESLVKSDSGGIVIATAIASISAMGATAYAIAKVIANHGEAIAIAYVEISNGGKTSTAMAIGGTDGSQDSQINLQANVQTIGETSAYADVSVSNSGDSSGLVIVTVNDPAVISQENYVQQQTGSVWSWIPSGMTDFDVYKFSVYWLAINESALKPKYNLEVLAGYYGDGNVSKLHEKMKFFINHSNNGNLTIAEALTYQQMITDYVND